MKVKFRTRKLEEQYRNYKDAEKAYGKEIARKYIQRVNIMLAANNINDLKQISVLKCHKLKGSRKEQWAVSLSGFYRLIFTLEGDFMEIIRIEEVSKHYDD